MNSTSCKISHVAEFEFLGRISISLLRGEGEGGGGRGGRKREEKRPYGEVSIRSV